MTAFTGTVATITPGQTAGVSDTLSDMADAINAFGTWDSWTPTWDGSSPAIVNGTLTGRYCQVEKTVHFRITLTAGSSTTFGGANWTFTLPVAATGYVTGAGIPVGIAVCWDTSASGRFHRQAFLVGSSTIGIAAEAGTRVGSASPFTWANGDSLVITGTYEAA